MKKILLAASLFLTLTSFSQEKTIELNCYNKWSAKFEDRGAEDVKDGVYDDVIISNRQGAKATCNNGKAEVISDSSIRRRRSRFKSIVFSAGNHRLRYVRLRAAHT